MKKVCWYGFLLSWLTWTTGWAQPVVPSAADSTEIRPLLKTWLAVQEEQRQPTQTEALERFALLASQRNWALLERDLTRELGVYYRETGQPDAAQYWLQRYFEAASAGGDSLEIALALVHLGNTFMGQGDHVSALEYNLTGLGIRERWQHREDPAKLANSLMFTALALQKLGRLDEAEHYYLRSLKVRVERTDSTGFALLMSNLASLSILQGRTEQGQAYYRQAMNFRNTAQSKRAQGAYLLNQAEAYAATGQNDAALRQAQTALAIFETTQWERRQADALLLMGKIYHQQHQYLQAEQVLQRSAQILQKRGVLKSTRDAYFLLYEATAATGQHDRALRYYRQYDLFKDSLTAQQTTRSLARLQSQQELARQNMAIEALRTDNRVRTQQRNLLLGGLALALLLLGVIYWINRARRQAYHKLHTQKLAAEQLLSEKETLLHDLRSTQQQLIQHEKMASLGQLTAGIAHELNNPLNFIINNTEALRMDYEELRAGGNNGDSALDHEIRQLMHDIEHGAQRMRHIVQELSLFSRSESASNEALYLPDILTEALHLLGLRHPLGWQIEPSFAPDLPLVRGNAGKLVQLFSNLLANASDALHERWGANHAAGHLQIAATHTANTVTVRIRDNGPGLSEETLTRLFDPFYTTKPVGKGTGLGLSIAFAIARAHQGSIEVESRLGEGATLVVTLPVASLG